MAFSSLFILANPDLLASFSEQLRIFSETLRTWIVEFAPRPMEIVFWLAVIWIGVGLLRPAMVFQDSCNSNRPCDLGLQLTDLEPKPIKILRGHAVAVCQAVVDF